MPVKSAVICKAILDGSGDAIAESQSTLAFMEALKGNVLGGVVADTPEGEAFEHEVVSFIKDVAKENKRLKKRAMELCMSQPLP